jgi:hypothetical protein
VKRWLLAVPLLALAACGGSDNNKTCSLADPSTCDNGLVCARVQGQSPICTKPVELQGRVFDLSTDAGIANARVTAEAVTGVSVGTVAITAADGTYTLPIPAVRQSDAGVPVSEPLKLSAAAKDYQAFPSGFRVSLGFDVATASNDGGSAFVVASPLTNIGLQKLPAGQLGLPSISGTVQAPADGGVTSEVLVAAFQDGGTGSNVTLTARADSTGSFTVFNVPSGNYGVQAFRQGANYTPASVNVASTDVTGVKLVPNATPTGTISGTANIVATTGQTSVVLALMSTYDAATGRGELVPGLRAPNPGTAPNVSGAFSIAGVPDGDYAVLAAFENDGLVLDPDPSQNPVNPQEVVVSNGTASASPTFKVTNAVTMVGPGAGDTVEDVTGAPSFTWTAYSSSQTFQLDVFDAFGTQVWNANGTTQSGGNQTVTYAGPTLTSGNVYWWHLIVFDQGGKPISQTEDLMGVFREK